MKEAPKKLQQFVLMQISGIRQVLDDAEISDDVQDAISDHLFKIFVQDDFTTHLCLLLTDELEKRIGSDFKDVYQQIQADANDATSDDLDRMQARVDADAGVKPRQRVFA